MKTKTFTFILLFITSFSFGQISYEKGYYIDNDNIRTECFIKNLDWKNNPTRFSAKYDYNAERPDNLNINNVLEFGIYGKSIFVRKVVNIDRSSEDINKLNEEKEPVWKQEKLFLRILISGKASLYLYRDGSLNRYFYSNSDTSVIQLVYKKYRMKNVIAYNNKFRQQLWVDVRCPEASISSVENLAYTERNLVQYFEKYNSCFGETTMGRIDSIKREIYSLKIAPGLNVNSLSTEYYSVISTDLLENSKNSFCIGLESEILLPYNNNKWGLLFAPTFQQLYSKEVIRAKTKTIEFRSIEFPIGVRHYMLMNSKSRMYLTALYISGLIINLNSNVNTSAKSVYSFGSGFEIGRASLEIRYATKRDIRSNNLDWRSEYSALSFYLGYKIYRTGNK